MSWTCFILPSATHTSLGSGEFSMDPAATLVALPSKWGMSSVVYNAWPVAGKNNRVDVN